MDSRHLPFQKKNPVYNPYKSQNDKKQEDNRNHHAQANTNFATTSIRCEKMDHINTPTSNRSTDNGISRDAPAITVTTPTSGLKTPLSQKKKPICNPYKSSGKKQQQNQTPDNTIITNNNSMAGTFDSRHSPSQKENSVCNSWKSQSEKKQQSLTQLAQGNTDSATAGVHCEKTDYNSTPGSRSTEIVISRDAPTIIATTTTSGSKSPASQKKKTIYNPYNKSSGKKNPHRTTPDKTIIANSNSM